MHKLRISERMPELQLANLDRMPMSVADATGQLAEPARVPSDHSLALHSEIMRFVGFMDGEVSKNRARSEDAVRLLKELAREVNAELEVEVFGSYLTNLQITSSDIDVVVILHHPDTPAARSLASSVTTSLSRGDSAAPSQNIGVLVQRLQEIIHAMAARLQTQGSLFDVLKVLESASVPVIKVMYRGSGDGAAALPSLPIDVTFAVEFDRVDSRSLHPRWRAMHIERPLVVVRKVANDIPLVGAHNGISSSYVVSTYLGEYPALPPLTIVFFLEM